MGSATLGQVGLGHIKRVAEQAKGIKTVSSIPSWFLFQFLPPGSCLEYLPFSQGWTVSGMYKSNKPFSPKVGFDQCFFFFLLESGSPCSLSCPGTHFIDQAGL